MLPLILASTTFLFSCAEADSIILNVYQNDSLPGNVQQEIIGALLETTPPECSAHFYDE